MISILLSRRFHFGCVLHKQHQKKGTTNGNGRTHFTLRVGGVRLGILELKETLDDRVIQCIQIKDEVSLDQRRWKIMSNLTCSNLN